jgi:hypothetical protein
VYRDGTWFVKDQTTRYLGLAGDRPVILPAATYDRYY